MHILNVQGEHPPLRAILNHQALIAADFIKLRHPQDTVEFSSKAEKSYGRYGQHPCKQIEQGPHRRMRNERRAQGNSHSGVCAPFRLNLPSLSVQGGG